jgi:peptide/nickel transport system permease protein
MQANVSALGPLADELRQRPGRAARAWRLARQKPLGAISLAIVVLLLVVAAAAPIIAPADPAAQLSAEIMKPPSAKALMGTDHFGRDILSRVIYGAQISLLVGVSSVLLGTVLGALIGVVSGYFEGSVDNVLQRLIDVWMAFPPLVFALAIVAALGPSLLNVVIAIGLTGVPRANRVVRGTVLSEKHNAYIDAARVIGCAPWRLMLLHLLPNVTAPIIVIATLTLGQAILAEASLSFLGLGVQPPTPTWGSMLSADARRYMLAGPWVAIFPGLAITLTVLAWNLLGDALRDIWDPKLRVGR